MKALFQWIAKNLALSFFLGTEIACLLVSFALVLANTFKSEEEHLLVRPAMAQVVIIAEEEQEGFVQTEMAVFTESERMEYAMIPASRARAIEQFARYEQAILILSSPLSDEEIAALQLQPDRLPLNQERIDHATGEEGPALFFIRDQIHSVNEDKIAGFLSSDASQDLVFQKYRSKANKRAVRNG